LKTRLKKPLLEAEPTTDQLRLFAIRFRHVFVLESSEQVEAVTVERVPLYNDKRAEHGPFDIIGDVHGCCDELEALLPQLGYEIAAVAAERPGLASGPVYAHPLGRKAVFVGDLVDRGPRALDTASARSQYGSVWQGVLCPRQPL
jgi:hypothetical protein